VRCICIPIRNKFVYVLFYSFLHHDDLQKVSINQKYRLINVSTVRRYDYKIQLNNAICANAVWYNISDTIMDMSCKMKDLVDKVKIDGAAAADVCSLYISGGDNIVSVL
jgi:hypothetical protein